MTPPSARLTDRVVGLLATHGDMAPDELVGFFAGLFSVPELIQPRRWLREVGVSDSRFADLEETQAFLDAAMALYNDVGRALEEDATTLRLYSDLADAEAVAAWCSGYLRAYELQEELLEDEDPAVAFVFLMAVLAGEVDPEEAFDADGSEHDSVEDWLAHHREALPGYVGGLYERWLQERRGGAPSRPTVRSGPKVGRNDPCPCGSGKKYKKCCMK